MRFFRIGLASLLARTIAPCWEIGDRGHLQAGIGFEGQTKAARNPFWRVQDVPRKRFTICMLEHLSSIPHPRLRKVKQLLINLLFMGMVASLCGAEDFVSGLILG